MTITYSVDAEVSASFDGGLPHEAFLNWCVDQLTSLGDVEDVIPCSHEERGRAVHGFAYSDHDARLDLFITNYQRAQSAYTFRKDVYEPLVKRLENSFGTTVIQPTTLKSHLQPMTLWSISKG